MINIHDDLISMLTPNELYLLCKLVSRMSLKDNTCYPSIDRLCEDCTVEGKKWSRKRVVSTKNSLIEKGVINEEKREKADGGKTSNRYTIQTDLIGLFLKGRQLNNAVSAMNETEQNGTTPRCETELPLGAKRNGGRCETEPKQVSYSNKLGNRTSNNMSSSANSTDSGSFSSFADKEKSEGDKGGNQEQGQQGTTSSHTSNQKPAEALPGDKDKPTSPTVTVKPLTRYKTLSSCPHGLQVFIESAVKCINHFAGTRYRANTKATLEIITSRLEAEYSHIRKDLHGDQNTDAMKEVFEDFKKVITYKTKEWLPDDKYRKYIQPTTLFSGKFSKYLEQAENKELLEKKANKAERDSVHNKPGVGYAAAFPGRSS